MLMLLGIPVQLIRILLTWVAFTGKPCINILIVTLILILVLVLMLILIYYKTTNLKNKYYKFQETGDKKAIISRMCRVVLLHGYHFTYRWNNFGNLAEN